MSETEVVTFACPPRIKPGRSKLLLGSALVYAIAALDVVCDQSEAASCDRNDMVVLFLCNFPNETHREMLMANVERVFGRTPDLVDWRVLDAERRDPRVAGEGERGEQA